MMPKKSRFPQQLGWEDYLSFMRELLLWLVSQLGKPDHLPALEVGLEAKVDDYEAVHVVYAAKKNLAPELRKLKDSAIEELREALKRIKMTLPVFFPDPAVLGEFNLAQAIQEDEDELYIQASACMAHWALVSADPEYATLVPDFTVAQAAFDDFKTKRETYTITFQAMQAAQNDMEQLRIPIQEQERKMFDWYRSRYPDANDAWWTDTPWGTSSGGEEPVAPVFPAKPVGFDGEVTELDDIRLWWLKYAGAKVNLYRADGNIGGPALERPNVAFMTGIINESFTDTNLQNNRVYYYWICAVVEGVEGEFAGPVVIEYKK